MNCIICLNWSYDGWKKWSNGWGSRTYSIIIVFVTHPVVNGSVLCEPCFSESEGNDNMNWTMKRALKTKDLKLLYFIERNDTPRENLKIITEQVFPPRSRLFFVCLKTWLLFFYISLFSFIFQVEQLNSCTNEEYRRFEFFHEKIQKNGSSFWDNRDYLLFHLFVHFLFSFIILQHFQPESTKEHFSSVLLVFLSKNGRIQRQGHEAADV